MSLYTIKKESKSCYIDRGSKFIGILISLELASDFKANLKEIKKQNPTATHVCSAYRIMNLKNIEERCSDDGEPFGSAGQPILNELKRKSIVNSVVFVIRYYGGVNLGVGGLMKAYREAAKSAIENGDIIPLIVYDWVDLRFSYEDMPFVMNILKKYKLDVSKNSFEEICKLTTFMKLNEADKIKLELKKISSIKIIEKGIY